MGNIVEYDSDATAYIQEREHEVNLGNLANQVVNQGINSAVNELFIEDLLSEVVTNALSMLHTGQFVDGIDGNIF